MNLTNFVEQVIFPILYGLGLAILLWSLWYYTYYTHQKPVTLEAYTGEKLVDLKMEDQGIQWQITGSILQPQKTIAYENVSYCVPKNGAQKLRLYYNQQHGYILIEEEPSDLTESILGYLQSMNSIRTITFAC
jgi:hypothetical protein